MDLTKLAFSSGNTGTDADVLKMLGKRAAARFVREGNISLDEAVDEVLRERGDLNPHQVRRVVEHANQTAWKETFAAKGADARFDPADPERILRRMNDQPDTPIHDVTDYLSDVPESPKDDAPLREAFRVKGESAEYPDANPLRDAQDAHNKSAAAVNVISEKERRLSRTFHDMAESTYSLVKQAYLQEGAGLLQMTYAFGQVTDSDEFVEDLMSSCIERMKSEGVKVDEVAEMDKVASAYVVNHEHPLMTQVAALEKVAEAYCQIRRARQRADIQKAKSLKALKDKLRSL